ncbi:MAG: type II secretion system protein [Phycisphaerales bacterium]|nr:type II secretion system protein [Phycisphaerales bacterium]
MQRRSPQGRIDPCIRIASASDRTLRRGFSLLELLTVISVTIVLTSLMVPAIGKLKENANRIVCSSNQRQMGIAFAEYGHAHKDRLPESRFGQDEQYEMMASYRADGSRDSQWDGVGLLYAEGYCREPGCLYCPSHHGEHAYERYVDEYYRASGHRLYTNYQYTGHLEWPAEGEEGPPRIKSMNDPKLILLTDGLRTRRDFNHISGMNVLRADTSVFWWGDQYRELYNMLPLEVGEGSVPQYIGDGFEDIWDLIKSRPGGSQ